MSYALVNILTGEEFRRFSGEPMPGVLDWPNGDVSHAPSVGDERVGYRFVKVAYDTGPLNEFYSAVDTNGALAGNTFTVSRRWVAINLDAVKAVAIDRLRKTADRKIVGLASHADLARAIVAKNVPEWGAGVTDIDARLAKSIADVQGANTVDVVAAALKDFA